ncbi:hypothetical protein EMIT0347P_10482 [Pseudomonas sp. IT-347P]
MKAKKKFVLLIPMIETIDTSSICVCYGLSLRLQNLQLQA